MTLITQTDIICDKRNIYGLLTKFDRLSFHDIGNSRHLIKETFTLNKSQSDIIKKKCLTQ